MIHKAPPIILALAFLACSLAAFPTQSRAERRTTLVTDSSSSGKLVRVGIGANVGMKAGEPVLFSAGSQKIAAGRVFRADESSAIIVVLEKYGSESPAVDQDYELLFGEPFAEAANLPDYVVDREEEEDNPGNERFFEKDGAEVSPDLDDDNYTPEITLRPKMPEPRTYSPHNLTVGLALYRNRSLPSPATTDNDDPKQSSYATYQGYSVRYAYTFRTHYWLWARAPALMSVEGSFGIYNFSHTFQNGQLANIRVVPMGVNLRYLIEVSKLFRIYPYVGYQYNWASAANGPAVPLENLRGGVLMGGAGGQLVMSNALDARVQGGTDGLLAGIVVKF